MQLISSLHLSALNKTPTHLSDVTPCLVLSFMGKAHAMGTTSHKTHIATSLGHKRKRQVSHLTLEGTVPLHNHLLSVIPEEPLLCH